MESGEPRNSQARKSITWPVLTIGILVVFHLAWLIVVSVTSSSSTRDDQLTAVSLVIMKGGLAVSVAGLIGYWIGRRSSLGALAGVIVVFIVLDIAWLRAMDKAEAAQRAQAAIENVRRQRESMKAAIRSKLERADDVALSREEIAGYLQAMRQELAKAGSNADLLGREAAVWTMEFREVCDTYTKADAEAAAAGMYAPDGVSSVDDLAKLRDLVETVRVANEAVLAKLHRQSQELADRLARAGLSDKIASEVGTACSRSIDVRMMKELRAQVTVMCDGILAEIDLLAKYHGRWKVMDINGDRLLVFGEGLYDAEAEHGRIRRGIQDAARRQTELQKELLKPTK